MTATTLIGGIECQACGGRFSDADITKHLEKECPERGPDGGATLFHIKASAGEDYRLDLEVADSATLLDLDRYLRHIWLECCNHLSGFKLLEERSPFVPIDRMLKDFLPVGDTLEYVYDMGTSSYVYIENLGQRTGKAIEGKIPLRLLARNTPYKWDKDEYGNIINSPRYGTCGYTGPALVPGSDYPREMYEDEGYRLQYARADAEEYAYFLRDKTRKNTLYADLNEVGAPAAAGWLKSRVARDERDEIILEEGIAILTLFKPVAPALGDMPALPDLHAISHFIERTYRESLRNIPPSIDEVANRAGSGNRQPAVEGRDSNTAGRPLRYVPSVSTHLLRR